MRTLVTTACAVLVTALAAGCDQAKAPPAVPPAVSSAPATPSTGGAPSAVAVNPSPSDAPKGAMTDRPNEAGSALGGTASGNVSDPNPPGGRGAAPGGTAPEPTGGDGTKATAKSEGDSKATKSAPSN